ncbi:hypothetical protein IU451_28655 [Nocardia cyriacigeorgica]|uniref:hypothetical protein n=1 Tax=Nocardia cyriacigeorgica TaxID=135487 RepID=UPI001895CD1D|nr:hypothetical protein [Nocardia cyriacigeorgica]MBF6326473.1 hypothetical protein [Nocardia cyriacigeorgica]
MNTDDYIPTAGYALAKFSGDQMYFPNAGDATILSWAETFAASRLTPEELRAGVLHVAINAEGHDFRPMPADIIRGARAARREAIRNLPKKAVDDMEAANHILQDLDYSPQEAHRISLQVALGHRKLEDLLEPAALTAFTKKFDQHRRRDEIYKDRRRELAAKLRLADLYAIEEAS